MVIKKTFHPSRLDGGIVAIPISTDTSALSPEQRQYQQRINEMAKCATAIGNLCFAWSALEGKVDEIIELILGWPNKAAAATLLANVDARDKMRMDLGLGHLEKISDEWFDVLKWSLNTIDSNLRNRRNRVIHDRWHINSEGIKRVQKKPDFAKHSLFPHPNTSPKLRRQRVRVTYGNWCRKHRQW